MGKVSLVLDMVDVQEHDSESGKRWNKLRLRTPGHYVVILRRQSAGKTTSRQGGWALSEWNINFWTLKNLSQKSGT